MKLKSKLFSIFAITVALILSSCDFGPSSGSKEPPKPTVTSISVKTLPSKTDYFLNEEFSAAGLKIEVTYSDETTEEISDTDVTISSPNMATEGEKTVKVTYKGKSTSFKIKVTDPVVTCINAGEAVKEASWIITGANLFEYPEQTIDIDFTVTMKVKNTGDDVKLTWGVNAAKSTYPSIVSHIFEAGTSDWVTLNGTLNVTTAKYSQVYIGTYQVTPENLTIYLKDLILKVTVGGETKTFSKITTEEGTTTVKQSTVPEAGPAVAARDADWLDKLVPSLKDTYSDKFDSMGLACEYASWAGVNELSVKTVRDGLSKHVDSISMGNEFKPDGFFGYQWSGTGKAMVDFKASSGLTIKVPKDLQFDTQDKCLAACKEAGLKMRGHVLAWHAQTPDNFFAENYVAVYDDPDYKNIITNRVSKEVMNARMEWYFSTVLKHVADWEAKNNNGEHIIWAWDVFNETVADDADLTNWVRGSTAETKNRPPAAPAVNPGPCGSRWYQCYEDTDFIVDAFRFANAYAPADVKLCYNDYNEYMGLKTDGILSLIKLVKAGEEKTVNGKSVKPRIDVMGLQSHVGTTWPGVTGYENALKRYLELVDCHVTELDISCTTVEESQQCWSDYFKMLQKYGKTYSGSHKITNVTIWGINNKSSWIYKDDVKYPVLFDDFKTTEAFWAVIDAHN